MVSSILINLVYYQFKGCLVYFFPFLFQAEIPVSSVDTVQLPRSAVSDLGLHCLPRSLLWDARHKWVNDFPIERTENHLVTKACHTNAYFTISKINIHFYLYICQHNPTSTSQVTCLSWVAGYFTIISSTQCVKSAIIHPNEKLVFISRVYC